MQPFPDDMNTGEARARFFERYGFGEDGGYHQSWVRYEMGPFSVPVPNSRGRAAAVPIHDLHHLATGYCSELSEEFEIAAWELGGGCGRYFAAWFLNFLAFAGGVWFFPRRLYRAFVRGRRSSNLYSTGYREGLLDLSLGELRDRAGVLGDDPADAWSDRLAFAGWVGLSALWLAALVGAVGFAALSLL